MPASSYSRTTLKNALSRQVDRLGKKITHLETWTGRISTLRLVTFLAGFVTVLTAIQTGYPTTGIVALVLFGILFMALVRHHRKLDRHLERFRIWKRLRSNHLARISLDWEQIPNNNEPLADEGHPYARDLNITGRHSLLSLIDTSIYEGGREQLKRWLLKNDPDLDEIRERHRLVRELKPMARFRDKLQMEAALVKSHESEKDWDMQTLLSWLAMARERSYRPALILVSTLAVINLILGGLYLAGRTGPWFVLSFLVYFTTYNFHNDKFQGLFDDAYQIEKLLGRFGSILQYLETYPLQKHPELESFCALYRENESSPSAFLHKISRISRAASSQKSELIWVLLNGIGPWDLYYAHRLNRYKKELEYNLDRWLNRFYKLEALCSLANFGWLNPEYSFCEPSETTSGIAFRADELGHPLIPHQQKVTNSLSIDDTGTLLLITGSNMAGKSTFLRTIGINLCLCFAGGPVNASHLHTIPFRIFSSLNVTDSLDEGLSHFYAEVKRLRRLLDALNDNRETPLFFMVDEIYRGTNNRERYSGSAAFLKAVAGRNGIGVISTHDLELAGLEQEIRELKNYHFEETIEDGKMRFEYKLRPGPCPTTNALKIMEMEGLPVE